MNILFVAGKMPTISFAHVKIVIDIITEFKTYGHNCIISGVSDENSFEEENGILMHRYCDSDEKNRGLMHKNYATELCGIINKYEIGILIATIFPFGAAQAVFANENIACDKYILQVDPWGLHEQETFFIKTQPERIAQEKELFDKAKYIFTTACLFEQYIQNAHYKMYTKKMCVLEFPTIKAHEDNKTGVFDFNSDYFNILFAGLLDDNYRNPEKFLDVLCKNSFKLPRTSKELRLYFLGGSKSKIALDFSNRFPNNIFVGGRVELPVAIGTMQKADVLLSIGNVFTNQVPSKIFDYFSLGKPILHVKKIEKCTSIKYLDRYPLKHIFDENKEPNLNGLGEFLNDAIGKNVDFKTVRALYEEFTPEYVAKKMENIICCDSTQ